MSQAVTDTVAEPERACREGARASWAGRILRSFGPVDTSDLEDAAAHRAYLVIMLVLALAPFLGSLDSGKGDSVTVFGVEVPSLCLTRQVTGKRCPGCGLTRSFVLIAGGRFREALRCHRIGLALYVFCLYEIVFRAYCLRRGDAELPRLLVLAQQILPTLMIALLVGNWIIGLWLGSNGS